MHTTPNSDMPMTIRNSGQSKYFIRLRSNWLSRMYLKNARILENMVVSLVEENIVDSFAGISCHVIPPA